MTINLIPPKIKKQRKAENILDRILSYFGIYLAFFCFLFVTLYISETYIRNSIATTNKQIEEENRKIAEFKDTEESIKQINSKLKKIDSIENEKIYWSLLIDSIAKSSPENVQIKSITTSSESNTISISGYAVNRREIAKIKDKMEDSKYFKNVNFSTSNYDEAKNNFTFNISCTIEAIK